MEVEDAVLLRHNHHYGERVLLRQDRYCDLETTAKIPLMVRHLLKQITEYFEILETFTGENYFDHCRGTWMFYPHKGNVRIAIDTWTSFVDLWTRERDTIEAWCQNYLAANRVAIFNQYMTDIGTKAINELFDSGRLKTPADFQWPDANEWNEAVQLATEAHAKNSMDRCDDPAILEIHEGRECDYNGFFCWHCDDMEWRWNKKVKDDLHANDNVFLNERARRYADPCAPPATWTGPAVVSATPPNHGSLDGKTPFQAMKAFIDNTMFLRFTLKDRKYDTNTEYVDFLKVWTHRHDIDATLPVHSARIAEIEALLS